jgi:hypothetical protein
VPQQFVEQAVQQVVEEPGLEHKIVVLCDTLSPSLELRFCPCIHNQVVVLVDVDYAHHVR